MSKIDDLIAYGLGEVGKPYVYGAEGPSTFDCSGLMQFVFAHVGINLPRTADQQYRSTKRVSSPLPGDLVFYVDRAGRATHVSLYLGGGKMLEAPHTGADVRVRDMYQLAGHQRFFGRVAGSGAATGNALSTVADTVAPVFNPLGDIGQGVYGVALQVAGGLAGAALIVAGVYLLGRRL